MRGLKDGFLSQKMKWSAGKRYEGWAPCGTAPRCYRHWENVADTQREGGSTRETCWDHYCPAKEDKLREDKVREDKVRESSGSTDAVVP